MEKEVKFLKAFADETRLAAVEFLMGTRSALMKLLQLQKEKFCYYYSINDEKYLN